jgi:hypothetical protein
MIRRAQLLADLKVQVRDIERDLRERFISDAEYNNRLTADWQAARNAGRTSEALETWAEAQFTQSAVAWVLACVFVRFCEDNDLLDAPLIAGAHRNGTSAEARQEAFYLKHPIASDNDYLRDVFARAARLPGLADVVKIQRVLLTAPVSAEMGKQLVRFFRATDADSGALAHDFADPDWNTRFLGDLYQDLSEAARKRYALLQTPEFIESFILDRTLTPALDIYTLEEVDVIDPTCGSGHFLLGAFERLAPRWLRQRPDNTNVALQEALDRVVGVDLNPFAVAIARFRLLVAVLRLADVKKLSLAPDFHLHIETGDSLLHGFNQLDYRLAQTELALKHRQENLDTTTDHHYGHAFAAENLEAVNALLSRKYAVVVGNPPYITVKDRAVSELYRSRYASCSGKYALVAPFCERFWALARGTDHTRREGFVGLIVANSFMKREFGKKLVEEFFPTVDLTHVIDTSGAYIPGHGTPTVILFGRNRNPVTSVVRAVMGIKGEPSTPDDPAHGVVWSAIVEQIDRRGSESEWVSVADVVRGMFAKHPWSIGGGGAAELVVAIENSAITNLAALADKRLQHIVMGNRTITRTILEIGFASFPGADEIFVGVQNDFVRAGITEQTIHPAVLGENVRDWLVDTGIDAFAPYDEHHDLLPLDVDSRWARYLWPYRKILSSTTSFNNQTKDDLGLPWWSWYRWIKERYATPLTITFGEVATHNHFVLDRGGKVFKQTAPVIKLPAEATEDDHLGLLGLLNSSTACFWFQQVCHNKGGPGGGSSKDEKWHDFYALNSTKVGQFPIASERPVALARQLDTLASTRARYLPDALFAVTVPTQDELSAARDEASRLRALMVAWQEELDWQVYKIYGVLDDALCYSAPPEIRVGERAFEIVLARQCAAGTTTTPWFERHNAQAITEIPAHWPTDYRALVEKRITAIERLRDLALIERPECKRRWAGVDWETLEKTALENWLLDRLEGEALWPRDAHPAPRMRSVRELIEALSGDDPFRRALDLYAGTGNDAHATLLALIQQASVPYLSVLRYKDSGLRKHGVWQNTWARQRQEDAIDAEVRQTVLNTAIEPQTDHPPEEAHALAIAAEQARRKASEVGEIPVPPKYKPEDFRELSYWKLRGALDVPKERFVSFPGLERSKDPGSPVLLWAGYDAKARALSLATYLYEMVEREGADLTRITPALAGLDELLPWVVQWHPEIDDDMGVSLGDYLQGLFDAQLTRYGLTLSTVRAWQPPAPVRRPRGRRASTTPT